MSGISLKLDSIKVVRSSRTILDVDSLHIEPGQFLNIIGTNGAGKSTLMKLLCGLIKPTSGKVCFDQTSINSLSSWSRTNLKKQIGYIPQSAEYNSQLPFTLREIVLMGRTSAKRLFANLNKTDYHFADRWIERVGLSQQKNQIFSSLSGGEQQKVLIARAMVQEPKILMLDEPTSSLDFHWKGRITSLVKDLHAQLGITVLLISHELSTIPIEAQRTVLLDDGKVIADGTSEQVLTSDVIQKVYNCRIMLCQIDDNKYIINRELP